MTSESKQLITALRNVLSKLELEEAPGPDEQAFAELKHILRKRIQDLENRALLPAPVAKPATNAD